MKHAQHKNKIQNLRYVLTGLAVGGSVSLLTTGLVLSLNETSPVFVNDPYTRELAANRSIADKPVALSQETHILPSFPPYTPPAGVSQSFSYDPTPKTGHSTGNSGDWTVTPNMQAHRSKIDHWQSDTDSVELYLKFSDNTETPKYRGAASHSTSSGGGQHWRGGTGGINVPGNTQTSADFDPNWSHTWTGNWSPEQIQGFRAIYDTGDNDYGNETYIWTNTIMSTPADHNAHYSGGQDLRSKAIAIRNRIPNLTPGSFKITSITMKVLYGTDSADDASLNEAYMAYKFNYSYDQTTEAMAQSTSLTFDPIVMDMDQANALSNTNFQTYLTQHNTPIRISNGNSDGYLFNNVVIDKPNKQISFNLKAVNGGKTSFNYPITLPYYVIDTSKLFSLSLKYGTEYDWSTGSPQHYGKNNLPKLQLVWNKTYFDIFANYSKIAEVKKQLDTINFISPAHKTAAVTAADNMSLNLDNIDQFTYNYNSTNDVNIQSLPQPEWKVLMDEQHLTAQAIPMVGNTLNHILQTGTLHGKLSTSNTSTSTSSLKVVQNTKDFSFTNLMSTKEFNFAIDPNLLQGQEDQLDYDMLLHDLKITYDGNKQVGVGLIPPRDSTLLETENGINLDTTTISGTPPTQGWCWNVNIQTTPISVDSGVVWSAADGSFKMNSDFLVTERNHQAVAPSDAAHPDMSDFGYVAATFTAAELPASAQRTFEVILVDGVWYVPETKDANHPNGLTLEAKLKSIDPTYSFVKPYWDPSYTSDDDRNVAKEWWATHMEYLFNKQLFLTINPFNLGGQTYEEWYTAQTALIEASAPYLALQTEAEKDAYVRSQMAGHSTFDISSVSDNGRILRNFEDMSNIENVTQHIFGVNNKGGFLPEATFADGSHKVNIDIKNLAGINNSMNFRVDTEAPVVIPPDEITKQMIDTGNGIHEYYESNTPFEIQFEDPTIKSVSWVFTDSRGNWRKVPYHFTPTKNGVSINIDHQGLMAFEILDRAGNSKIIFTNIVSENNQQHLMGVFDSSRDGVLEDEVNPEFQDNPVEVYDGRNSDITKLYFVDHDLSHNPGILYEFTPDASGGQQSGALAGLVQTEIIPEDISANPELLTSSLSILSSDSQNPLDHQQLQYGDEIAPYKHEFDYMTPLFNGHESRIYHIQPNKMYRYTYTSSIVGSQPQTIYFWVNSSGQIVGWNEIIDQLVEDVVANLDPEASFMRIGGQEASTEEIESYSRSRELYKDYFTALTEEERFTRSLARLETDTERELALLQNEEDALRGLPPIGEINEEVKRQLLEYEKYVGAQQALNDLKVMDGSNQVVNPSGRPMTYELLQIEMDVTKSRIVGEWEAKAAQHLGLTKPDENDPSQADALENYYDKIDEYLSQELARTGQTEEEYFMDLYRRDVDFVKYNNLLVSVTSSHEYQVYTSVINTFETNFQSHLDDINGRRDTLIQNLDAQKAKLADLHLKTETLHNEYLESIILHPTNPGDTIAIKAIVRQEIQRAIMPMWNMKESNDPLTYINTGYAKEWSMYSNGPEEASMQGKTLSVDYENIYETTEYHNQFIVFGRDGEGNLILKPDETRIVNGEERIIHWTAAPDGHPTWNGDLIWNGAELEDVDHSQLVEQAIINAAPDDMSIDQLLKVLDEYNKQVAEGGDPDLDVVGLIEDSKTREDAAKPPSPGSSSSSSLGIILGVTFGTLALAGVGGFFFWRKQKTKKVKN